MTETRKKERAILGVILSLLLAVGFLPITPYRQGYAGTTDEGVKPTLTKSFVYDPNAEENGNSFVQEEPYKAIFNDSTIDKPSTNSLSEAIKEAIKKDIADAPGSGEDSGEEAEITITSVEWASFDKMTPKIESPSSDGLVTVEEAEADENLTWKFSYTGAGTATVCAALTAATVNATYNTGTELDQVAQVTLDAESLSSISLTYGITITNAYAKDKEDSTKNQVTIENTEENPSVLVYGGDPQTKTITYDSNYSSAKLLVGDEECSGNTYYDSNYKISIEWKSDTRQLSITVTPKKACDNSLKDVKIKLAGKTDVTSLTIPVTIGSIAKKQITFKNFSLPCRVSEKKQLRHAKKELNKQAQDQAVNSDDKLLDKNKIEFDKSTPYPANPINGGSVKITPVLTSKAAANYEITNIEPVEIELGTPLSVPANALENFKLSGQEFEEDMWLNKDDLAAYEGSVVATCEGYKLSQSANPDEWQDSCSMNSAEGAYENQTLYALYAKDTENEIVFNITGISYNVDTKPPVITNFGVYEPQPKTTLESILFYENKCHTIISVSDDLGTDAGETPKVSGLSSSDALVSYTDSKSGNVKEVSEFSIDENKTQGTLEFDIDGDQDVKTNSFAVTVKDNAGNVLEANTADVIQIPASVLELVADAAAPTLSVTYDNNTVYHNCYYNADRTATFEIHEAHFDFVQKYDKNQCVVHITETESGRGYALRAENFKEVADDTYQASFTFNNDGVYTISAQAVDLVDKKSECIEDAFTLDKTAPALNVSFDNNNASNGMYYNAPRSATITLTEHNFDASLFSITPSSDAGNGNEVGNAVVSDWSSSGDTHTATVYFPSQGNYSLSVNGCDLANNASEPYTCPEFVVDTIVPEISITVGGDADASTGVYGGNAELVVTINDTNVDVASDVALTSHNWNDNPSPYAESRSDSATEVSVNYGNPAQEYRSDGVYTIEVHAIDMAGNTESKSVAWSVNRFGSSYILTGYTPEMLNGFINNANMHDVTVMEINPGGLSLSDDNPSVSLTHDSQNIALEKGTKFEVEETSYKGWPAYNYTIGKENFASDGTYQVTLHSEDKVVGHSSENTMKETNEDRTNSADIVFTVDNTKPICSFVGFEKAQVADSKHTVELQLEDNIALKEAKLIYADGHEELIKNIEKRSSATHPIVLDESNAKQALKVQVTDMAGNTETYSSNSILVNSNFFIRLINNPPMLILAILILAACGGGLFWFFYKKRNKDKQAPAPSSGR